MKAPLFQHPQKGWDEEEMGLDNQTLWKPHSSTPPERLRCTGTLLFQSSGNHPSYCWVFPRNQKLTKEDEDQLPSSLSGQALTWNPLREWTNERTNKMFPSIRPQTLLKGWTAQLIVQFVHHFSSITLYKHTWSQRSSTKHKVLNSYVKREREKEREISSTTIICPDQKTTEEERRKRRQFPASHRPWPGTHWGKIGGRGPPPTSSSRPWPDAHSERGRGPPPMPPGQKVGWDLQPSDE